MSFQCGIIGMPNVGKSTLFNVLTKSNVPAKNFPFCTIKPNIGITPVLDVRLNEIANIVKPHRIVPAYIEFVDIAGLVKGASKGEGLGNLFLTNIYNTDVIFHVVRCFIDNDIIHINNQIKPISDIKIINRELILSDLSVCSRELLTLKNDKKKYHIQENKKKILIIEYFINALKKNQMLRTLNSNIKDISCINYLNLITLKPVVYIANISDNKKQNICLDEFVKFAQLENSIVIPICILEEYKNINIHIKSNDFLKLISRYSSELHSAIQIGYNLLNLQTFFTVGKKEIRAWSIKKGITSLQAAKKIHTDLQKGFIRAQVISYVDFIQYKTEKKVREFGRLRSEGKEYIVQDGDIIHFLFNI